MVTLKYIQKCFGAYKPIYKSDCNVRALRQRRPAAKEDAIFGLHEYLSAVILHSSEFLSGPSVFSGLIRDQLRLRGLKYTPHQENSHISREIPSMLHSLKIIYMKHML